MNTHKKGKIEELIENCTDFEDIIPEIIELEQEYLSQDTVEELLEEMPDEFELHRIDGYWMVGYWGTPELDEVYIKSKDLKQALLKLKEKLSNQRYMLTTNLPQSWCVKNDGSQRFKDIMVGYFNNEYALGICPILNRYYGSAPNRILGIHDLKISELPFGSLLTIDEFVELSKSNGEHEGETLLYINPTHDLLTFKRPKEDNYNHLIKPGSVFHHVDMSPKPIMPDHYIICAAVKTVDDKVYTGKRHSDCFVLIGSLRDITYHFGSTQGFVDNHWQFKTRSEAYKIAEKAGQLNEKAKNSSERILYSEYIY